jgi:hypothetical protein
MPLRNITGPVIDAAGIPVASGELHITPQVPAGTAADGFVIEKHVHTIESGAVTAPVVVPGEYKIELFDAAGTRLRSFSAAISDASPADISLKEVWETRAGTIDLPPGAMLEGDSILRLAAGKGMTGDLLQQADGKLVWGKSPNDMRSAVYDPHGRRGDIYNRANHVGSQPISSVTGLADALAAAGGLTEYAVIADIKPPGTTGGSSANNAESLRTLNTIEMNNSGLGNAQLLDAASSTIRLNPGRIYFGWAHAPAYYTDIHYLILRSIDGTIAITGPSAYADRSGATHYVSMATVQFHIVVPAGGSPQEIQIYHYTRYEQADYGLGTTMRVPGSGMNEGYARITLLSRPV